MHRNDRFSADVIKIFHNAKGSLKTKILEWTDNEDGERVKNSEHHNVDWTPHNDSPHNYAAGDYEPLFHDQPFNKVNSNESSKSKQGRFEFGNERNNISDEPHTNIEPISDERDKNFIANNEINNHFYGGMESDDQ